MDLRRRLTQQQQRDRLAGFAVAEELLGRETLGQAVAAHGPQRHGAAVVGRRGECRVVEARAGDDERVDREGVVALLEPIGGALPG